MSIKSFWNERAANKLLIIVVLLWVALAVIFGIYDLNISKTIYDATNPVGNLVESFGEIPGALFGLFAILTFWAGFEFKEKSKSKKTIIFLGTVAISTFIFYYVLNLILVYLNANFKFTSIEGFTVGLGLVLLSLIGMYLFKTKFHNFSKKNFSFSKVSVYTFIVAGILVEILKNIWGRVRFRDLATGFSNFTAWYLPQGLTGNHSFPSGHAYLGFILIPLFLLFLNKNKIWEWVTIIITVLFGLFISFERVLIGAHFASDVTFSAGIVIVTFLILYKKILPAKSKDKEESPSVKQKTRAKTG